MQYFYNFEKIFLETIFYQEGGDLSILIRLLWTFIDIGSVFAIRPHYEIS